MGQKPGARSQEKKLNSQDPEHDMQRQLQTPLVDPQISSLDLLTASMRRDWVNKIVAFLLAVTNYRNIRQAKGGRAVWACSIGVQSIVVGKHKREQEAASHAVSAVRNQKEMNTVAQLDLFLFSVQATWWLGRGSGRGCLGAWWS